MLRSALLAAFWLMAGPALGQIVSYEAAAFPETDGWIHYQVEFQAERFIEDGWLFQVAEILEYHESDTYYRSLAEFTGSDTFFVEWVTGSNGPSEAIPWVAPVVLTAYGTLNIIYHFTIADDLVRLILLVGDPGMDVWVEIGPGVHTYRLELYGTNQILWFIDGELVYAGVPQGPYPTSDSEMGFRCTGAIEGGETVCSWDYIRYGTIPIPASGDFDSGGQVDSFDFYFLQECLTSPSGSWVGCAWADMDFDGDTDCDDWTLFVAAWTDPADPPIVVECMCAMADLNETNAVDAADLALLLGAWGPNPSHPADLNNDGSVNASDLALLLGAWGPCK